MNEIHNLVASYVMKVGLIFIAGQIFAYLAPPKNEKAGINPIPASVKLILNHAAPAKEFHFIIFGAKLLQIETGSQKNRLGQVYECRSNQYFS